MTALTIRIFCSISYGTWFQDCNTSPRCPLSATSIKTPATHGVAGKQVGYIQVDFFYAILADMLASTGDWLVADFISRSAYNTAAKPTCALHAISTVGTGVPSCYRCYDLLLGCKPKGLTRTTAKLVVDEHDWNIWHHDSPYCFWPAIR